MAPNTSRPIRITFKPKSKGLSSGALSFTYIEEDIQPEAGLEQIRLDEGVLRVKTFSNAKEFEVLQTVKLQGIGGVFGLQINDCDFEEKVKTNGSQVANESTIPNDGKATELSSTQRKDGVKIQGNIISMDYSKITTGTTSIRTFEIKNTGDTVIEAIITDLNGQEIGSGPVCGKNNKMKMVFSATKLKIPPNSSVWVEVLVEVMLYNLIVGGRRRR